MFVADGSDDSFVNVLPTAARGTRPSPGGRRGPDENVQEETKAKTVLPVQRYTGLREYRD